LNSAICNKFSFEKPIIISGRSLAITLPADIVKEYKLKRGHKIKIVPETRNALKIMI